MPRSTLNIRTAQLLVIDMQAKLLAIQHDASLVETECVRLLKAASVLNLPVTATTQNAERLGGLVAGVAEALPNNSAILDKLHFSVMADVNARLAIQKLNRSQIVLCGVESHICVCQTALDLLDCGFQPFVVCDAVTARTPARHKTALRRLENAGVVLTCVESVVYELLEKAGTLEFRALLPLFK